MIKSIGKIFPETSALFVCDIQSKFANNIFKFQNVVNETKFMIKACNQLGVPVIATEQYPKGLGKTVESISEEFDSKVKVFEKTLFSMYTADVEKHLKENPKIKSIMIAGIETHVCVLQTTLDLLEKGYDVHIIENAVSSSTSHDRQIALDRLKQSGAWVSTTESLIFQLTKDSKHNNFKNISQIVKDRRELTSNL